MYEVRTC